MREIRCRKCRQHKTTEHFALYDNGKGMRHRHTCRSCRNEYQKQVRANDGVAPVRPEPVERRCTGCDKMFPVNEFSWNTSGVNKKKYRSSRCKVCKSLRARQWWDKHGKTRGRDKALGRMYGLSAVEYDKLLASQGGVCAICCKEEEARNYGRKGKRRSLCVDHCHTSNKARGILCATCNNGLGCFKDDPKLLHAALKYLAKHDAI